ncbi:hypothetical protein DL93DRAFT_772595 [Clavulina sp. PMI_390]|nr:hypothetical protein DL93DRAFT_772595 [Clavulina sp. PMI_390]
MLPSRTTLRRSSRAKLPQPQCQSRTFGAVGESHGKAPITSLPREVLFTILCCDLDPQDLISISQVSLPAPWSYSHGCRYRAICFRLARCSIVVRAIGSCGNTHGLEHACASRLLKLLPWCFLPQNGCYWKTHQIPRNPF